MEKAAKVASTRLDAVKVGVGSVVDLQGNRTFVRARRLAKRAEPTSIARSATKVAKVSRTALHAK